MAANDSLISDGNRQEDAALDLYLSLQSFTNLYCVEVMPVMYFRDGTPNHNLDERCPGR
jgi:hypothetical protein